MGREHTKRGTTAYDRAHDQYFRGTAHASGRSSGSRRAQHVDLRDDRAGGLPGDGRGHPDLHASCLVVEADAAGYGLALSVGGSGQGIRAVREGAAGSLVRKEKGDRDSGHRFMVFVLHQHDGFPINALLDVIDRTFPFDDHDSQTSGSLTSNRKAPEIKQKKND